MTMHGNDPEAQAPPAFVGGTIDRADQIRTDPARAAIAFAAPDARCLVMAGLEPVEVDGHLVMAPLPPGAQAQDYVLLGMDEVGRPTFARIAGDQDASGAPTPRSRALAMVVPAPELALYGTARSLVHWHARHPWCSVCGARTAPHKAGWVRRCGGCDAEHFPRVDPVAIMLAEHDGRVLLGRQHGWPKGRYSALAGFIEPGETIEEAVARELKEEAGISVHSVRYVMNQPWPFPSSLMIACMAQADDDALTLDPTEIEDAFWCDAAGVRAAMAGDRHARFIAPPTMAVAWHLLDHWLGVVDARQVAPAPASA